ncbi:MAG: hypothetical protein Q4D89_03840 [Arachnia propionica]|uniref:hypothetical protein n=1 Tax=Arachnia propionica TaxID=1750 RepID=UPI002709320F|nr:hypothetical protein [Arachnia propionica]
MPLVLAIAFVAATFVMPVMLTWLTWQQSRGWSWPRRFFLMLGAYAAYFALAAPGYLILDGEPGFQKWNHRLSVLTAFIFVAIMFVRMLLEDGDSTSADQEQ